MFDVFVSYGHADQGWVRTLAENLHREGLEVFYDEWEIGPGDVLVHRLDEGIRTSRTGILVVSAAALASTWVLEEYAAMLTRAVTHGQRLVPVLLGEAELPPFLASRLWVDFRHADGTEYLRRVGRLVAALRGEGLSRPVRGGPLVGPPGSGFRPEGPREATLRLGPAATAFTDDRGEVSHVPRGVSPALRERLWELDQARRGGGTETGESVLHRCSLAAGTVLTEAFLVGSAGTALAEAVAAADWAGGSVELAVEVDDSLVELPWETLRLPHPDATVGPPLVLHPHVNVYRTVAGLGPTPAMAIPGPLRLLVAIGSPDVDNERGELLDYEAELARLLDAVEAPRREERAYVRLLNAGTVSALREALDVQRFHVLHLSCHARPGVLDLEDEEGREDQVTAARFTGAVKNGGESQDVAVLPPDRGVPLVVLAGCATALAERDGEGEAALPGLARALLAHGVPAVLAMTAAVSDGYATALTAELYRRLASAESPNILTAVSDARRQMEAQRNRSTDRRVGAMAEWATPALFARGRMLPLFDRTEPFEELKPPPEPQFGPEVVVRRVGEFVGRRAESRHARQALRQRAGLVIHGIGGVGKSTLAAHSVAELREQAGLVVALSGSTTTDAVLAEIGRRLLGRCLHDGLPDAHPWRRLSGWLREPKLDWRDRLDLLITQFCSAEPLVLMLDNFEDNLTEVDGGFVLADTELAAFLSRWVRTSTSRARLLITARHTFPLPDQAERWVSFRHLGPLSWPETRKLFWRLPGLDVLPFDQQRRAYQDVGGHPRTLEYVDALLRGAARFPDVAARMERALAARGLTLTGLPAERAGGWTVDTAVAEAITLAVDDVVLGQLLDRLQAVPLARRLLVGASVYRLPVDDIGLHWQISDEQASPADPERDARLSRVLKAASRARADGRLNAVETWGFAATELDQLVRDLAELRRPPLRVPLGVEQAKAGLLDLGLLAPARSDEPINYLVHRWTASTIATQEAALTDAHQRAARFWRWRVWVWPQSQADALAQLLEARYHHHAAGELDQAIDATEQACDKLDTWGAYSWEERLCQETLTWIPDRSRPGGALVHQLGILAEHRGDYGEAERQYRRALAINQELNNGAGAAANYHQLGILAGHRGDYPEAERQFRHALAIDEELGNRTGMASSYAQLGVLAGHRGDYGEAERQHRRALAINQELNNGVGAAVNYHNLGILAEHREDYPEAERQFRHALAIDEELGNRVGIAADYLRLGQLAHRRRDYPKAERQFRLALAIDEELGNRTGMARSYSRLGMLAEDRGDYPEAERQFRRTLAIAEELGERADMVAGYGRLGELAHRHGDYPEAERQFRHALGIAEELGERKGIATGLSALGALLTDKGDTEDAVGYNVRSLAIRLDIGSRDARIDRDWLRRQHGLLGDDRFDQLLRTHVDDASIENLKDYLSQVPVYDQGLQQHLSRWEPMIAAVVATTEGNEDASATDKLTPELKRVLPAAPSDVFAAFSDPA